MPRVAVIADSHFDEASRFEECVRIHDWIADDLGSRGVDMVLHSGDIYERRSTPRERFAVARWVQRIAAIAPVVIARGNHDAIGDLPLLERLKTRHPIFVYEGVGVVRAGGCAVGVLAWPQRSNLHTIAGAYGHEVIEQHAADALRNVLRGLGQELAEQPEDHPRILLSHAMVRASRVSTGQPLVGCDFELGLEDLALAGADLYALGHIHLGQDWTIAGAPCVYPGSPRRTAFGELEAKGYVLVNFDEVDGHRRECEDWPRWERVETPATPMLLGEDEWGNGEWLCGWTGLDPDQAAGAEIRLRYRVAADEREAARAAVERVAEDLRARGAVNVKLDEIVRPEQRARAPEIATAQSLEAKLDALWRARSFEPGERRAELVGKAHGIEEEVRHAS